MCINILQYSTFLTLRAEQLYVFFLLFTSAVNAG